MPLRDRRADDLGHVLGDLQTLLQEAGRGRPAPHRRLPTLAVEEVVSHAEAGRLQLDDACEAGAVVGGTGKDEREAPDLAAESLNPIAGKQQPVLRPPIAHEAMGMAGEVDGLQDNASAEINLLLGGKARRQRVSGRVMLSANCPV